MAFRRVAATLVGGSFVGAVGGWYMHDEISKRSDSKPSEWVDVLSPNYKLTQWNSNWDKRAQAVLSSEDTLTSVDINNNTNRIKKKYRNPGTPTATRNLFLIRHGQYNLKGPTDAEQYLTELGREQAERTGKRLVELGFPFTKLTHSTLTRACETAGIIHKQLSSLPVTTCDLLIEGTPFPPTPSYGLHPDHFYFQDGTRIEAAFRKYFHRADPRQTADSYEIIVCHANVIRYFVCRALQLPPEAWLRFSLYHASITHFVIRPSGNVSIRTYGDAGHMPQRCMTTS